MKKCLILIVCLIIGTECYAQKIKVACVGNSITYGAGINNREQNSYPAQLQAFLGDEYEVRNFGVSGTTALYNGITPYINTESYKESLEFNPDIVFIKFGTNDAGVRNNKFRAAFGEDYRKVVDTYRNLPSKPRVILLTPIRSFLPEYHPDDVIVKEIIPIINLVAYERNLDIINLHNLYGDKWQQHLMPDKLHPSSIGAAEIAAKLYHYLNVNQTDEVDIITSFALKPAKEFNFYGYKGYQYNDNGVTYYIVRPHQVAKGNPWIWRARFWGHEPQVDIDLLEQGFHLTYCDVADLFGSYKAVARWDRFYKLATDAGLSKKAVLEGMSRGGLIVYNWAVKNTDKVACIYADAPVMDIKSWPFDWGEFRDTDGRLKRLMASYDFADTVAAYAWKKNPIDHARKIAKANIPIIHVVGDADTGVPVAENTVIFEERLAKYGYTLNVIHKPNVGHHPHSLNDPEPIVSYILKATGYRPNMCAYPVPGCEFRSAAGWSEGSEWHSVAKDIETTLEGRQLKLLLLGNSITQMFGGNRQRVVGKAGKAAMDASIGANAWESAGISGDRTQHLLWRIKNCNYNRCTPKNVAITIGINNVTAGDTPKDIAEGILACAEEARLQFPESRIILFGLLPAGKQADSDIRKACNEIHSILAKSRIKGVEYINPTKWFVQSNGELYTELYGGDFLHLSQKGYEMWSKKIADIINK
ncbi:MAG: prolyl oligopeptidase family serine peptidase [Alistipes sp.]|nr:prolyl oligopeptidase family serine peptidase [Alistipes sp.]